MPVVPTGRALEVEKTFLAYNDKSQASAKTGIEGQLISLLPTCFVRTQGKIGFSERSSATGLCSGFDCALALRLAMVSVSAIKQAAFAILCCAIVTVVKVAQVTADNAPDDGPVMT
jgi:hypothetical protein